MKIEIEIDDMMITRAVTDQVKNLAAQIVSHQLGNAYSYGGETKFQKIVREKLLTIIDPIVEQVVNAEKMSGRIRQAAIDKTQVTIENRMRKVRKMVAGAAGV